MLYIAYYIIFSSSELLKHYREGAIGNMWRLIENNMKRIKMNHKRLQCSYIMSTDF